MDSINPAPARLTPRRHGTNVRAIAGRAYGSVPRETPKPLLSAVIVLPGRHGRRDRLVRISSV